MSSMWKYFYSSYFFIVSIRCIMVYVTDTKMPYFSGTLSGGNRSPVRSGGITP